MLLAYGKDYKTPSSMFKTTLKKYSVQLLPELLKNEPRFREAKSHGNTPLDACV
jgi:hypothetical protein